MKKKGVDLSTLTDLAGMDIGTEPDDIKERLPLIQMFPSLSFSIGAGPWCAGRAGEGDNYYIGETIKQNVKDYKPGFLGEIGIDYHWNYGKPGDMEELFDIMLDVAEEVDLPVCIHNRDADDIILHYIRMHDYHYGLMHCFSSNRIAVKRFLDEGYYISFAGNATYSANEDIRDAVKLVPLDRILVETDSPYLSPMPLRGKINTPMNIVHTYECIAQIKRVSPEELNERVRQNFYDLEHGIIDFDD